MGRLTTVGVLFGGFGGFPLVWIKRSAYISAYSFIQ